MEQSIYSGPAKNGTLFGTLLIFLANVSSGELVKTVLLAATGSAVSFIVSFTMKGFLDWVKRRKVGKSAD